MAEAPLLELRGVSKTFGAAPVLADVSVALRGGERLAVIGPNGAGKTTLINLVTGLYPCDSGTILLNGRDITTLPAHRRLRLGMARSFQKLSLFDGIALAHRVIVLDGPPGRIIGDFSPDLPRPADRLSAAFFAWKRRLTALFTRQSAPPPEAVFSDQRWT